MDHPFTCLCIFLDTLRLVIFFDDKENDADKNVACECDMRICIHIRTRAYMYVIDNEDSLLM